jgi:two-component system OmpR family sensor kinase
MSNLLRNAIVHTPAGTAVEVNVSRDGDAAVVDVIDHGHGVPPPAVDRIFERFQRIHPEQSRDQGGSGLGLSIASAVVSVHGGRLSLLTTPGGGATFRVELPLAPEG